MGVFTCLPSFWRACQCLRRYTNDKKNKKLSFPQDAFPHLFNMAKYLCGMGYYMTLSMWRINRTTRFQAPFLTFALLNSLYTCIWDVVMDWSLGNPYAKRILLRDELGFRHAWVYYAAIVLDVVVRFNWIFYAIFSRDIQHSAFLSFFVGLSEVFRRGVWSVFRVENEHCANVMKFYASREPTLPYKFDVTQRSREGSRADDVQLQEQQNVPSPVIDVETGVGSPGTSSVRARYPTGRPSGSLRRLSFRAGTAHTQDFERRQLPSHLSTATIAQLGHSSEDEETEDDGDYTDTEGGGTPVDERDDSLSSSGSGRLRKEMDSLEV
jgi:xenotropic and polytropic retrovirus receptor 1